MTAIGPPAGELPHEAYVAALASLEGVGPARLRWLLAQGPPRQAWADVRDGRLRRNDAGTAPGGVDDQVLRTWRAGARALDPARLWSTCMRLGVGVVTLGAAGYPAALVDDPDPPIVLFQRGDPDLLVGPRVAVVGTRRATGYGLRFARRLGAELTEAGVGVVSGLALGIDAAAHQGAVAAIVAGAGSCAGEPPPVGPALHGAPVAVVAAGHDAPCPVRNRALAGQVAEYGLVLSEAPPGVGGAPWRFPVRNRIIAGLADAVVVVESAGVGGSMHTVREALDRDRPVLAVPGPVGSRASEGANELLRDGAAPCLDVQDVLLAIDHVPAPVSGHERTVGRASAAGEPERRRTPTGAAAAVLDELGWRPTSLDELAQRCGFDFAGIASAVLELERDGWVERNEGWIERIARVPEVRRTGA
jgi:DNA processing protein